MTEEDVDRIERELNVRLPGEYRQVVCNFPIPADRGTSDSFLWDDPDALIELNCEYREGYAGLDPWPDSLFMIGDDGAACPYVLDLKQTPAPVLHLDHGQPDQVLEQFGSINEFVRQAIEQLRADGVDFETPPHGPSLQKLVLWALICAALSAMAGWAISFLLLP